MALYKRWSKRFTEKGNIFLSGEVFCCCCCFKKSWI